MVQPHIGCTKCTTQTEVHFASEAHAALYYNLLSPAKRAMSQIPQATSQKWLYVMKSLSSSKLIFFVELEIDTLTQKMGEFVGLGSSETAESKGEIIAPALLNFFFVLSN